MRNQELLSKIKATEPLGLSDEAVRKVRRRLEDHLRKCDPLLVVGLAQAFGCVVPKSDRINRIDGIVRAKAKKGLDSGFRRNDGEGKGERYGDGRFEKEDRVG